jgi:glycosyltransferase involved in cell wall biosynthesis
LEIDLNQPVAPGDVHNLRLVGVHDRIPTTVDYIAGENILIHISLRPEDAVVVVNDRIDGIWRTESRIELPAALMSPVIEISIQFDSAATTLAFTESDMVLFHRGTDLADVTLVRSTAFMEFSSRTAPPEPAPVPATPAVQQPPAANAPPAAASTPVPEAPRRPAAAAKKTAATTDAAPAKSPTAGKSKSDVAFEVQPYHQPILKVAVGPTGTADGVSCVVGLRYWGANGELLTATPHGFKAIGSGVFERRKPLAPSPVGITEEISLVPPYGAAKGEVQVSVVGKTDVSLTESPAISSVKSCQEHAEAPAAETSAGQGTGGVPIVYSTSAGPFREDVLRLRPHYLSENFGKLGFEVTYIPLSDTIPVVQPAPGITQVRRSEFFLHMQSLLQRHVKPGIFICSSLCDSQTFLLADLLKDQGWTILYEVRDDPGGMKAAGAGYGKWYNANLERRMCRTADAVITVSGPLRDRAIAFGAPEDAVHVLPNGLEEEAFRYVDLNWSEQAIEQRKSKRVKIGYFGHMFGGRFDVDAVAQAAKELPKVKFELVGPGLHDPAQLALPNVELFGQKTIEEFYEISSTWDVGILPFKANSITFSLDPIKYYQYLAAGLKVVHSDVHNLRGAPFTFLYTADRSLKVMILRALGTPVTKENGREIREYLSRTTWELRTSETLRHLGYGHQAARLQA